MSDRNYFIESTKEADERLQALMRLYPEIFSDGKINLDAFKDVTGASDLPEGVDKTPGYYGLYWPGKRGAKQLARKEAEGTLEPVAGEGVSEDTTHNIYIEGDNLEVLRILKQSYKARVNMIYIDPPYNTGNDFIYPDDYKMPVEEYLKMTGQKDEGGKRLVSNTKSGGAFHTNWLNMMYPRLQLARELLTEDGVIIISIDENESGNLRNLCDEIFGEENFIGDFYWEATTQPINAGSAKFSLQQKTENLYMYAKRRIFNLEELTSTLRYPHKGKFGKCRFENIEKSDAGGYKRNTMKFKILGQDPRPGKRWQIGEETARELERLQKLEIVDGIVKKAIYPEDEVDRLQFKPFWSLLTATEVGTAEIGKDELNTLFDTELGFDTVKPITLIKKLIKHLTDDNAIILDFFSGSATTAHAVMQLNAEDRGHRKFIMVQLPHACDENSEAYKAGYKNICEIGKERIRRAGAKILEEAKANKDMFTQDAPLDTGFKVFRLQKSNFVKYTPVHGQDEAAKASLFDALEGSLVPLAQGWKQENVLTEIILRQGFALDCKKERLEGFKENAVWKITDSPDAVSKKITLYVCLDDSISGETIKTLALGDDEKFVCLDSAIDDSNYARLSDKGRIETI